MDGIERGDAIGRQERGGRRRLLGRALRVRRSLAAPILRPAALTGRGADPLAIFHIRLRG